MEASDDDGDRRHARSGSVARGAGPSQGRDRRVQPRRRRCGVSAGCRRRRPPWKPRTASAHRAGNTLIRAVRRRPSPCWRTTVASAARGRGRSSTRISPPTEWLTSNVSNLRGHLLLEEEPSAATVAALRQLDYAAARHRYRARDRRSGVGRPGRAGHRRRLRCRLLPRRVPAGVDRDRWHLAVLDVARRGRPRVGSPRSARRSSPRPPTCFALRVRGRTPPTHSPSAATPTRPRSSTRSRASRCATPSLSAHDRLFASWARTVFACQHVSPGMFAEHAREHAGDVGRGEGVAGRDDRRTVEPRDRHVDAACAPFRREASGSPAGAPDHRSSPPRRRTRTRTRPGCSASPRSRARRRP